MKILVNANSLEEKGGISVLNNFIRDINNFEFLTNKDISITVIVPYKWEEFDLITNNKVKVIKFNTNKNRLLRKLESNRKIKRILEKDSYDAYLSLQNTGLRSCNISQYIFIHTALPFVNIPKKYNIFKYSVILKIYYKLNINRFDGIFVQSNWLKNIIINKFNYHGEVFVERPVPMDMKMNNCKLDLNVIEKLNTKKIKFLYPTRNEKYKNIETLIEAINKFNSINKEKVELFLTFEGNDSENIKYIGNINYKSMNTLYKNIDAIIFPSLVETLGLPLQEAKLLNKDILVSKLNYSQEILGNHDFYFNPYCIESIVQCIEKYVYCNKNKFKVENIAILNKDNEKQLGYGELIKKIYYKEKVKLDD
ncbi:glycosyltransferase [Clostridium perfringens]|nr:glycosyltransferase [Clostridium perfringens]